jgi:hypothetical protein
LTTEHLFSYAEHLMRENGEDRRMSTVANATFGFASWDEEAYVEEDGQIRLALASITNTIAGDIEGESTLRYLMAYLPGGGASFTGHEYVTGSIAGRTGTFVLKHEGLFSDGQAHGSLQVVPGSATGDLAGLTGNGSYVATDVQPTPFTLEYELG